MRLVSSLSRPEKQLKILVHRTDPTTEKYPAQNVSSAEAEKLQGNGKSAVCPGLELRCVMPV